MRTNIVIDDKLIAEAMKLSGARTKREAVEDSLRLMVQLKRQERIRSARGKLKWTGDLDQRPREAEVDRRPRCHAPRLTATAGDRRRHLGLDRLFQWCTDTAGRSAG
ncbi:MAG: type II toxin-antitoxin system VapB family antitoxin [Steroidobacteraceae bacterium]|nr:type II toxin-antitoxin system VapB family antitoxin [Steroidobacteraceae bacterium]